MNVIYEQVRQMCPFSGEGTPVNLHAEAELLFINFSQDTP